jgi:hypothetical protein
MQEKLHKLYEAQGDVFSSGAGFKSFRVFCVFRGSFNRQPYSKENK